MHVQDCRKWSGPFWYTEPALDLLLIRGRERNGSPGATGRGFGSGKHHALLLACLPIEQHQPRGGRRIFQMSIDLSLRTKEDASFDKTALWRLEGDQMTTGYLIEIEVLLRVPELTEQQMSGVGRPIHSLYLSWQVSQRQLVTLTALHIPDRRSLDSATIRGHEQA